MSRTSKRRGLGVRFSNALPPPGRNALVSPDSPWFRPPPSVFAQQQPLGQGVDALVGEHALGALVDDQTHEAAVDVAAGYSKVAAAIGGPVRRSRPQPLNFSTRRRRAAGNGRRQRSPGAEAEGRPDALARKVRVEAASGEEFSQLNKQPETPCPESRRYHSSALPE